MAAAGTSGWWFAKMALSIALLGWCGWTLATDPPERLLPGQVLVVLGGVSNLWHYRLIKRRNRTLGAPTELVTRGGLFRWVRHPMYTSDLVLATGLVLLSGGWLAWALFTALIVTVVGTANREYRMMQAAFGDAFLQWRSRTGLLLPRLW